MKSVERKREVMGWGRGLLLLEKDRPGEDWGC